MSRESRLWIDRENGRDPDAGPFSSARWRRQALEAEALARPREGVEPEPSVEPPRRRRLLPVVAFLVALIALAVSLGALLLDPGDDSSGGAAMLAPAGGRLAPTQIGRVYDSAGPGVVLVRAGAGEGSGFVVRDDGTIVTNSHVVGDSQTVQVRFADKGELVQAEVLGVDRSSDLAVLRVDPGSVGRLTPLPLADSSKVRVGDAVVAIGHPFGLERTTTAGIVSGLGREIQAPDGFPIEEAIQTDAAINPGNSGGPLLDSRGRVVGVNTQIATGGTSRGNVGVGFAVPSNTVRDVLPALSRGEKIRRPYLGVVTASHPDGAQIQSVTPGGPAESAGLERGEVITSVDGREVNSPDDVAAAVSAREPGDQVDVELSRGGRTRTVVVELGTRP